MARRTRILYLHLHPSTFVQKDIAFLRENYDVEEGRFSSKGLVSIVVMMVRQIAFILARLRRTRVIFVMFGGYHSFIPALMGRIFGKKVYIILGGTDCVSFPSMNYGTFRKRLPGRVSCMSYRLAHRLLPVHESLMERHDNYYREEGDPDGQGVYFHCKGLKEKTPFTAIYNGYEPDKWDSDTEKVPGSFITVSAISSPTQIVLKGIDLISEMAVRFPECTFIVVGFLDGAEALVPDLPNIRCIPYIKPHELRALFAETSFYFQISVSEGFPNALAEAMLSTCIPIGSPVASIPDIIGDTGYILEKRDADVLENLLKEALALPDKRALGLAARKRISDRFPLRSRGDAYLELVKNS